jgi:hypothetical protein
MSDDIERRREIIRKACEACHPDKKAATMAEIEASRERVYWARHEWEKEQEELQASLDALNAHKSSNPLRNDILRTWDDPSEIERRKSRAN